MKIIVRSFWIRVILLFVVVYQINGQVNSAITIITSVDNGQKLNATHKVAYKPGGGNECFDRINTKIGATFFPHSDWSNGVTQLDINDSSPYGKYTFNLPYSEGYVQGSPVSSNMEWLKDSFPKGLLGIDNIIFSANCEVGCLDFS